MVIIRHDPGVVQEATGDCPDGLLRELGPDGGFTAASEPTNMAS